MEESARMAENRDKWRKYVYDVDTLGSRTAKEQNSTDSSNIHYAQARKTTHANYIKTWTRELPGERDNARNNAR